jgi:CRISPR-associated protein (TIGR03984 family)
MTRQPGTTDGHIEPVSVDTSSALQHWLAEQMQTYDLPWLLAVSSEGLVWGKHENKQLHLSSGAKAFPASGPTSLNWADLDHCRCFGEAGELLVWTGPDGPTARLRRDGPGEQEYLEEHYQLWGEGHELSADGIFVRLVEGQQGIIHCPPLRAIVPEGKRATLRIRHYLEADSETGITQIVGSRLVALCGP